jgi:hypothetical protein
MALLGFVHGHGHHGHQHAGDHGHGHLGDGHGHAQVAEGHGHVGHGHTGHGHAGHAGQGHVGYGHAGQGHHADNAGADGDADGDGDASALGGLNLLTWVLPLISPLNWFSWMVGAGAAGSLAISLGKLTEPWTGLVALVGAIAFNKGVVRPIWNLVFQFAAKPAGNLEGCLAQVAEAATGFNERGEGLVRLNIDGRSEDVYARLTPQALAEGSRVRRGDRLMVEEIDPRKNECRVSRM